MDADGGKQRQLTVTPASVVGWLPNGDAVVLNQKSSNGQRFLQADARSGQLTPLTTHDIPTRTVALKQLTFDAEMMGFPTWSPDGRWLAVEMKRGDDGHLSVVPSDGSGAPEQLTFARGQSWPGGWSPDGDKIAFAGQRDGVWNIWWVSRRTKRQQQLTRYTAPNS